MHPLKLFDLHCDTASLLFDRKQSLAANDLHIDLDKANSFDTYIQTMAVWSDYHLSDEAAWERFFDIRENLLAQLDAYHVPLIRNSSNLAKATESKKGAILAVEDARILAGCLHRLDTLYDCGVRFLTLTWSGETCIGGSHDTDAPLTDFGRAVVERCFSLGIVPDVSHASRQVTAEVLAMAKQARRPVIATHSNAFSCRQHTRNLTDAEFCAIAESGGVVGISLAREHLADGDCSVADAVAHIRHYLSLGGEHTLCLGCDFDGIDSTPRGLSDLSCLPSLAEALSDAGISDVVIHRIFFENAYGFAVKNL